MKGKFIITRTLSAIAIVISTFAGWAGAQDTDPFGKTSGDDPFAASKQTVKTTTHTRIRIDSRSLAPSIADNNANTEENLNQVVKADYFETRFADLVAELRAQLKIEIIVDDSAVENNLDDDVLITMAYRGRASTTLDILLARYECTYAIKDGTLFVISDEASIEEPWLQLRDIDCRQMIDQRFGGDASALIDLTKDLVDSASWVEDGGYARIHEVDGTLFVSQTAKNIRKIRHLLDRLSAVPREN